VSNKAYIVMNEKGGVGKSTIARHFVSGYLFDKRYGTGDKESSIMLYEFDAHNHEGDLLSNEERLEVRSVNSERAEIEKALEEIEFEIASGEDVIVDIGGSDNLDRFLSSAKKFDFGSEAVFIVPQGKRGTANTESTVEKIRAAFGGKALIVVALNGFDFEKNKSVEEQFPFFYGKREYNLPPSPLIEDGSIELSIIPDAEIPIALSEMFRKPLWSLGLLAVELKGMKPEELMMLWGEDGKRADRETYLKKRRQLSISQDAREMLDKCEGFYTSLDRIVKAN
jgi:hypothetical protein